MTRPADLALAGRLFLWSLALPVLERLLPLPTLVRLAWARPRGTARDPERERRVVRLAYAVWARSPAARLDGNCLERSLAVYRCLSRLGAGPHLVSGVGSDGDAMRGHVWVTVDGEPLGEVSDALAQYAPVIAFGDDGREIWRAGMDGTGEEAL